MNKGKRINKNKPKGKKKQSSFWRYIILAVIVLVLYFFLRGDYGFIKFLRLQKQKKDLIKQIEHLKERQAELENEIDRLQRNYRYIEKVAREKYKMGKKGEKIFYLIPPNEKKKQKQK